MEDNDRIDIKLVAVNIKQQNEDMNHIQIHLLIHIMLII